MRMPLLRRPAPGVILVIAVLAAAPAGGRCLAQAQPSEEIDPTGGLRSKGMVPGSSPAVGSREELVRKWDLDGNGRIDASEASIARARMRRNRIELETAGGIDPVTGKPRAAVTEEPADEEPPEPDMDDAPAKPAVEKPALPGTRVPDARPAPSERAAPQPPAPRRPSAPDAPTQGSRRPDTQPTRPGAVVGGVRAGAPAARPGYGSLAPKPDLNAAVPLPTKPRVPIGPSSTAPRGGLLPSARPPAAVRPPAPPAATPRPPRVTADDIGGF